MYCLPAIQKWTLVKRQRTNIDIVSYVLDIVIFHPVIDDIDQNIWVTLKTYSYNPWFLMCSITSSSELCFSVVIKLYSVLRTPEYRQASVVSQYPICFGFCCFWFWIDLILDAPKDTLVGPDDHFLKERTHLVRYIC